MVFLDLVSREQPVIIEGTTIPAAPTAAAFSRKLRREMLDFFIPDQFI
jgi:hypothetical protein